MSEITEVTYAGPGGGDLRVSDAIQRLRAVSMGHVCKGVPYLEVEDGDGLRYRMLPFSCQDWAHVSDAIAMLGTKEGIARVEVAYVDVGGYALHGDVSPMYVLLAARGNPDFSEDPSRTPWGMPPDRVVMVSGMDGARCAVRNFIDHNGVGGGQWVGGDVWQGGKRLGGIAYNGSYFEAGHPRGYGLPCAEFSKRMHPTADVSRKIVETRVFDGEAMDDISARSDPEFALSQFEVIRDADLWRAWYAAEVEGNPDLGARTLSPAVDPVVVEMGDNGPAIACVVDAWRVGAAFLRGDVCINAIVFQADEPRLSAAP